MTTQCILPTELILQILYYTSPQDIIQWRTVSKWFRAITYDPAIWRVLYANATCIRPPGPFLSQSATSLERALVRSVRLAGSWTTQSLRTSSRLEIPFDGRLSGGMDYLELVGGRWLVVNQLERRVVLYDTTAEGMTRAPQILWEQKERIASWDKCSMISGEGQLVVYLALTDSSERWFVECRLDSESGVLCNAIALHGPEFFAMGPQFMRGKSRFLYLISQRFAFDTRTRNFYRFPKFRPVLETPPETSSRMLPRSLMFTLTDMHILSFRTYYCPDGKRCGTGVQALTVPDGPPVIENGCGVLRLSHEGIAFGIHDAPEVILRNSTVDPITGSINIRFLDHWIDSYGVHPKCIDMTLHNPSPVDVSPITFRSHAVVTPENEPLYQEIDFGYGFFDSSGDGRARGLFSEEHYHPPGADAGAEEQSAVVKFMVDGTQDRCVATLTQFLPVPAEWSHFPPVPPSHFRMSFDGARGKLYYLCPHRKKNRVLVALNVE